MGAWCPLVCGKWYVLSSSNSLLQPGEPLCPTLPIFSGPPAPVLTLYTKPPTKSTKKNKRGQGEAGCLVGSEHNLRTDAFQSQ